MKFKDSCLFVARKGVVKTVDRSIVNLKINTEVLIDVFYLFIKWRTEGKIFLKIKYTQKSSKHSPYIHFKLVFTSIKCHNIIFNYTGHVKHWL